MRFPWHASFCRFCISKIAGALLLIAFATVAGAQPAPSTTLTKVFSPSTIAPGGTTTLTFTLTNAAGNNPAQVVGFTDTLPAGLVIAAAPNTQLQCVNVTGLANAGTNTITVTTATVPASTAAPSSCTLSVDVTNVTGQTGTCPNASFTNGSTNISGLVNLINGAVANCVTVTPPTATATLNKSFTPTTIAAGATTVLTFTVTNPTGAAALSNVGFTDSLPAGLRVANATIGGTCANAAAATTAATGGTSIAVSNLQVPAGASTCTVTVNVTNATGQSGTCPNASFTNASANVSGLANVS